MTEVWRVYRAALLFPLTVAYAMFAVENRHRVFTRVMCDDVTDRLVALTKQFFDELPPPTDAPTEPVTTVPTPG